MWFTSHCGKPPFSIGSKPYIDEASSEAAFICAIICSILGLIGNLGTSFVLIGDKTIRNHPTTPFLLSLAVSDFIFSGFNLPVIAVRFYNREWVLGYGTCVMYPFFLYGNIIISAFSMAAIAVNRYLGIYKPHIMSHVFKPLKSWLMVLGIWLLAFFLMSLPLFGIWGQMGYEPTTFSCTVLPKNDKTPMSFLVTVGMILPCVTMVVCYALILMKVKQTGRDMRDVIPADEAEPTLNRNRSIKHMTLRRERELTKTLLLICTGFMICFFPVSLIMIFDPMPPCYKHPQLHVAGYVIFWCSAFINPIIYTLSNKNYRQALNKFLHKWCCKDRQPEPTSTFYVTESTGETMVLKSTNSHGQK